MVAARRVVAMVAVAAAAAAVVATVTAGALAAAAKEAQRHPLCLLPHPGHLTGELQHAWTPPRPSPLWWWLPRSHPRACPR